MAYDADMLLEKMRSDKQSDWPARLLREIADAPLLDERDVDQPNPMNQDSLTDVELRTLEFRSRGMNTAQIADAMFLSVETVKTHLRGARYRLKAKDTTHACCEAIRRGVIL